MLMNRAFFPSGLISYVNIQRQFFDSFVGQTFKVANHCHMLPQFAFHNFVEKFHPITDPIMDPMDSTDCCRQDADKLVLGYMLVFVYVNVMLSKMSCVEQRIGLSIVGILRWVERLMMTTNMMQCIECGAFSLLSS